MGRGSRAWSKASSYIHIMQCNLQLPEKNSAQILYFCGTNYPPSHGLYQRARAQSCAYLRLWWRCIANAGNFRQSCIYSIALCTSMWVIHVLTLIHTWMQTRACVCVCVCVCVYGPPTTVGALTLTAGSKRWRLQIFAGRNDDIAPITVASLSHISRQREAPTNKRSEATGTIASDYQAQPISAL